MKPYIFIFYLILFAGISPLIMSQNNQFKNERRIYLWDVTLSMKGYNGAPNIYDEVIEAIKSDINSITDEETEIIVLPFQTKILDVWKENATPQGKKQLIRNISNFDNKDVTYTNIYVPLKEVMQKYITADKRDVLLLLTDGVHNDLQVSSKQQLYDLIMEWCQVAIEKDAYAFYVMLTNQASEDSQLLKLIERTCRMSGTEGTNINFIELLTTQSVKYNLKDDAGKPMAISVICKKNVEIPAGVKIRVRSEENEYIEVNSVQELRNNALMFDVKFKQPYEVLKNELSQESNYKVRLHMDIENTGSNTSLVSLLSDQMTLELINKPEKTLKIYVQD